MGSSTEALMTVSEGEILNERAPKKRKKKRKIEKRYLKVFDLLVLSYICLIVDKSLSIIFMFT